MERVKGIEPSSSAWKGVAASLRRPKGREGALYVAGKSLMSSVSSLRRMKEKVSATFPRPSQGRLPMKLTTQAARTLPLPDGKTDHIVFDEIVGGFGLRLRVGAK